MYVESLSIFRRGPALIKRPSVGGGRDGARKQHVYIISRSAPMISTHLNQISPFLFACPRGCVTRYASRCRRVASDIVTTRASFGDGSSLGAVRSAYPFVTDLAFISEEVIYSGPIVELRGRKAYIDAMESWEKCLPNRLADFSVQNVSVFQLEPRLIQGKCTFSFVAALPPGSRERGLPDNAEVLPGDRLRVSTSIRSELILDAEGQIIQHIDTITDGYDVPATISRYEYLTAQNLGEPGPIWYWKVLRATTMEEQDMYAGGRMSDKELESSFHSMVARNFAAGLLLGAAIYGALKTVKMYIATSGADL